MVGKNGKVIAADLQEGMLNKLKNKIRGKEIESRIEIHKCTNNKIGVIEKVDFILAFYMVHEVSDQMGFFREIKSILKPDGKVFIIEPKFHVSKNDFEGPYKNMGVWVKEMRGYVKSKGKELKKMYFFYTTCPKCAQYYGKNYTVILAQV